ncbi:MAG TPA: hypothetical protein VM492_04345 [Sumerlaeia bacterium]|nr:hypothetical protein [Sumerlaeia bacterium]
MNGKMKKAKNDVALDKTPLIIGPRLPWEVPLPTGRGTSEAAKAERARSARQFAEVGKIDVLARIAELREEMNRVYSERRRAMRRVEELETQCAALRNRLADSRENGEVSAENKPEWGKERLELLDQILELQDRCLAAESERDRAVSELGVARAAMSEVTKALRWRNNAPFGENEEKAPEEKGRRKPKSSRPCD